MFSSGWRFSLPKGNANRYRLIETQINDNTGCYRVSLSFLSFFHDLCIIYGDSVGDMDLGLRLCMIYYMLDYYL